MEFRFEIDPVARIEIIATRNWIADRSPDHAEEWLQGLVKRIETLKRFPRRCPIAPEGRKIGSKVRVLTYGKSKQGVQRILFVIEGDLIRILSIRHSARGFEPL
jgi:plasmid stabilization system protein ParE